MTFLASHPKGFFTPSGVLIGWSEKGIFTTGTMSWQIPDFLIEEGFFEIEISSEADSAMEFIDGFKLETMRQMENLTADHIWMRYLNGQAEITIMLMPFEFELTFRIYKYKTMIYCPSLHFYDEVYRHLTIAQDFNDYLTDRRDFFLKWYYN